MSGEGEDGLLERYSRERGVYNYVLVHWQMSLIISKLYINRCASQAEFLALWRWRREKQISRQRYTYINELEYLAKNTHKDMKERMCALDEIDALCSSTSQFFIESQHIWYLPSDTLLK